MIILSRKSVSIWVILALVVVAVYGVPAYVDHTYMGYPVSGGHYGADDMVKFEHTVGSASDRLLVVVVGLAYNEAVTGVTWKDDAGQSLTLAEAIASSAGMSRTEVWYLVNPASGTDSINIDVTGGHDGGSHAAFNFSNVLQSDPLGATESDADGDNTTEPVIWLTTAYDSSYVLTVCTQHGNNSGPYTPSANQVEIYDTTSGTTTSDAYSWAGYVQRLNSGSQACSLDATGDDSDDDWGIVAIEIRQAGELDLSDTCCTVDESDTIDFGEVDTTSSSDELWILYNCGDSTFSATGEISGHPYFAFVGDSAWSMSSDTYDTLTFRFTPLVSGTFTSDVISSHDSCGGVVLKGTGVPETQAPSGLSAYYMMPSYDRGGYRAGNDSYSGTHPDTAWATLDYAESQMEAGDTLMIMGGLYTNAQRMSCGFATPGTPADPIVLKAYGDSVAWFNNTGGTTRGGKQFFVKTGDANHFVLDGCSYLTGDSLYLKFVADTLNGTGRDQGVQYMVSWSGSSPTVIDTGLVIRGCEFDGSPIDGLPTEIDGGAVGFNSLMIFNYMTDILLEKNYIHNVNRPTGCWHDSSSTEGMWGNQEDRSQSAGEGMFLNGTNRAIIRDNTFKRMNHGVAGVGYLISGSDTAFAHYIQFKDNNVDQRRGGFFYLYQGTHHCLVEGNILTHAGQSASFPSNPTTGDCRGKGKGLQISGDYMTIRKNVTYSPENDGGQFNNNVFGGFGYSTRHNRYYNNTIYKGYSGQSFKINQVAHGNLQAYSRHNRIFNNIFYDPDSTTFDGPNTEAVIYIYDAEQDDASIDMIDPNVSTGMPTDTHFGWNYFHNNIMCRDSLASSHRNATDYDSMVTYYGPSVMTQSELNYSLDSLHSADPAAWKNNIASVPLLASLMPDTYGLFDGWWYSAVGSPAIDAGRRLTGDFTDSNGSYVTSNAPAPPSYFSTYGITTYGWTDTLVWYGGAPDIGAYEVVTATDTCCTVTNIAFGNILVDATEVDSFSVVNCGEMTLIDTIDTSGWAAVYTLTSDEEYSIAAGSTAWFVVEFTPVAAVSYPDTNAVGDESCTSDVIFSGTGQIDTPSVPLSYPAVGKYRRRRH